MAARRAHAGTRVTNVRFGIQGSGQLIGGAPDPGYFREVAELAEELGYDSLWAGDHISFHNPILDVTVALAAFCAVTRRIALGAGVVLLPLRHPSIVAKEFAYIDYLSGGRLILGVGVGGEGAKDFDAVGVSPRERGARTDEAMLALRELFRSGEASFVGRFFRFGGVSIDPPPAQRGGPPLWVGGRADAALRRAGRLADGWMPIWVSVQGFTRGLADVRRHARGDQRDPDAIEAAVVLPALVGDDGERAREEARRHLSVRYGQEFESHVIERYALAGNPEECAERVREYAAAGARHILFNPAVGTERLLEQCERLYVEVAAPLRGAVAAE